MSVLVIAEAGVNHNGSLERARHLIDAAAAARADAVKFQTFRADAIVSRHARKAAYQERTTGVDESQLDMIRRLELSEVDHRALIAHAQSAGIEFLSTPFDEQSVDMLVNDLKLRTIKVASGEITNAPLLLRIAQSGCRIILSTGMSTLAEVEAALGVLAFGMLSLAGSPSPEAFKQAFASPQGIALLSDRVMLLHCTTEYPAAVGEVNLRAMETMQKTFGLPIGYSDHTEGIHVAVAAVARGACAIEKHFTLSRALPGPDHKASLEPGELTAMVAAIRDVEAALGDGVKQPSPTEIGNRAVVRKSLVAARNIAAGEALGVDNLTCKRPGGGISPMHYWEWLGRPARRAYAADELIEP